MTAAPAHTQSVKPSRPAQRTAAARLRCACGAKASVLTGECADCGRTRMLGVQMKLLAPGTADSYEREADRFADALVRPGRANRPTTVLHPTAFAGAAPVPASVADTALASVGRPLDASTRSFYERRLAHDFSAVRIHTGPEAAAAAAALQARAFTARGDVFFGAGAFSPHDARGRRLLAHELAHVVQQTASHRPQASPAAGPVAVQRQSLFEKALSGVGSLLPEAVTSALGLEPSELAAMVPAPGDAVALLKRLRDVPGLGDAVFGSLPTSDGLRALLDIDQATLDRIFAILDDPERELEALRGHLQPLVEAVPAYAMAEAEARLGWLRDRGEPFALVTAAVGRQLAQLPQQWWPIVVEIFRSQFKLWDWSTETAELERLAAKYDAGGFDDEYEYWVHAAKVLSGGLDRILGAIGMAAFVVGLAGGGTVGAAAAGTTAGAAGGAVTLGAGAAPSAAVGGSAGGAAGGGLGGGLGATVYELLGGVSLALGIATEVALLGDAAKDLALEEQDAAARNEDYEQVASSLIGLAMMAAFALLGSVGVRIAERTKKTLLAAARRSQRAAPDAAVPAAAAVDLPGSAAAAAQPELASTPGARAGDHAAAESAGAPAADQSPELAIEARPDSFPLDEAAPLSDPTLAASTARSSHLPNEAVTKGEVARELAYVARHPEVVTGIAPNRRAKLGDHEIAERPGGGCRRESAPPWTLVPCPINWRPEQVDLARPQTVDLAAQDPDPFQRPKERRYDTSSLQSRDPARTWESQARRLVKEAMRAGVAIKHPLRGAAAPQSNRYFVYVFFDEFGDIMKVGQTLDLKQRIEGNLSSALSAAALAERQAGGQMLGTGRPALVKIVGRELNDVQAGALERAIQRDLDVPGIAPVVPDAAVEWASGLVARLGATGFFMQPPTPPPASRSNRVRASALFQNAQAPHPLVDQARLAPEAPPPGAYSVYAFYDERGQILKVGITERDRIVERTIENLSEVALPSSKRVSAPFHGLSSQEGVATTGVRMQLIAHDVNSVQALALEREIGTRLGASGRFADLSELVGWANEVAAGLVRRGALVEPDAP